MRWFHGRRGLRCWSIHKLRAQRANSRKRKLPREPFRRRSWAVKASSETDLDAAFAILSHVGAEALLVAADPFLNSRREQLLGLAARYMIPAITNYVSSLWRAV